MKNTRLNKQKKSSPIKIDSHECASYHHPDEHYYVPNPPPTNYPNFAVYTATVGNYPNPSDSMYYDQKRMRLDSDHPHFFDYENNLSAEKFDYYSSNNHCYPSTNYPPEHAYHHHHTSVIVDSQQYFLNGWNGTTAF